MWSWADLLMLMVFSSVRYVCHLYGPAGLPLFIEDADAGEPNPAVEPCPAPSRLQQQIAIGMHHGRLSQKQPITRQQQQAFAMTEAEQDRLREHGKEHHSNPPLQILQLPNQQDGIKTKSSKQYIPSERAPGKTSQTANHDLCLFAKSKTKIDTHSFRR
ncbi:hypothetical protein Nepgr_006722 [Nepenthes gracilis]|uniref:Secreted protein n=1 Tax=Nepenthes gracilis TaxID=150966 RepID=A0AAD3S5J6_NEPGR|nr:hypothetical protein Nepgr_006722 [Nepenthes gracilis]